MRLSRLSWRRQTPAVERRHPRTKNKAWKLWTSSSSCWLVPSPSLSLHVLHILMVSNNSNNDDNNRIQRCNLRFFTISSLRCELSPNTYTQVAWAQLCANHLEHIECLTCCVMCHMVWRDSSAIKFNRVEIAFIWGLFGEGRRGWGRGGGGGAEPLNQWQVGQQGAWDVIWKFTVVCLSVCISVFHRPAYLSVLECICMEVGPWYTRDLVFLSMCNTSSWTVEWNHEMKKSTK